MKKRVLPLLLATTMVLGLLAGCGETETADTSTNTGSETTNTGSETANTGSETTETAEITAPDSLTIMVDGTLVATTEEGQAEFIAKLQELTGIANITIIQPDHSSYYDNVSQIMASDDRPDAILLSSTYLQSYAAEGILWDMTEAYENSDLKARHEAKNSGVYVDAVRIDGNLYGMPFQRGGGCVTYVRQSWLDAVGLTAEDITNYDAYIDMLRKFKAAGLSTVSDYVIGAAGFIGTEAPWINYWPEFYQDAYPTFVQQEDGTWVDGFEQDSMKAALQRMADAVAEGLIDLQSLDQKTSDARTKFASGEYGVFTYWANHWAANLETNISKALPDEDNTLVALEPIDEVGTYINRLANVWCIVDDLDGDDTREQAIFKYFIETMQDGAETQFLWTYGVEGVHYSYAAGTVLAGTEKEKTYEDGTFHWLEMLSDNSKLYSKMHITAVDALVTLENDPNALAESAIKASEMFTNNCRNEDMIPSTEVYAEYNGDLMTIKNTIVAKVVTGEWTVDQGYAYYVEQKGDQMSAMIVESLNNQ